MKIEFFFSITTVVKYKYKKHKLQRYKNVIKISQSSGGEKRKLFTLMLNKYTKCENQYSFQSIKSFSFERIAAWSY